MTKLTAALALLCALISSTVRAEEGLFFDPVPDAIKRAWENTIIFVTEPANRVCTAALVDKKVVKGKNYLFFLSAGHCVIKRYPRLFANDEAQTDKSIVQDTITATFSDIHSDASDPDWMLDITGASFPLPLKPVWTFQHYGVDSSKVGWDFLVIAFETEGDISQVVPLEFSSDKAEVSPGAVHYAIGFPGTVLRPIAQQKVAIPEPTFVRKRWSMGSLLEGTNRSGMRRSTADGLPGSSGGPIIAASGKLIGLCHGGHNTSGSDEPDHSYAGLDHPKPEQMLFYSPDALEEIVRSKVSQFVQFMEK